MMTDFSTITTEELEKMDTKAHIAIIKSLQGQLSVISNQLNFLTEQIALMNQRSFGRKTEKADVLSQQLSVFDYFNEPEALCDDSPEPDVREVVISGYTRASKTKREEKLEGLPARIFDHKIEPKELEALFPDGYKELPEEVYKRLSIIPQTFLVDEHHIHVYASKNNDGTIIRAKRPADVFRNSIATPSLLSAMIVSKYANHVPLERQSRYFADNGVRLDTNTMANWMIKASDIHLSSIYEEMHKRLFDSGIIHADETPFEVIRDGRSAGSKSYMWVYRTGKGDKHPIILFDYQPTRRTDHPDEFLKDYSGILITDGYQVYHSLEKKREGLMVAGCWVHAKRKFAEIIKADDDGKADKIIAAEAARRISALFNMDEEYDSYTRTAREKARQRDMQKPVDEFFEWAKSAIRKVPAESATAKGLQYCINQEPFLRVFLKNGDVPMDNNLAEQAIRPFTLGRKNWVNMSSPRGAQASAILYSLVETARANHLRLHDYFEYLITELSVHKDDQDRSFISTLLPWSKTIQQKFRAESKK